MTHTLTIRQLLDCWNSITGQTTRMVPSVERSLYEFQKFYTLADLELTLTYVVAQNKKSTAPWSLRFGKFFDDEFKHFESIRGEAEQHKRAMEARKRAWQPTTGQRELAAMRHEEVQPPKTEPKKVDMSLVIAALRKGVQEAEKQ